MGPAARRGELRAGRVRELGGGQGVERQVLTHIAALEPRAADRFRRRLLRQLTTERGAQAQALVMWHVAAGRWSAGVCYY